MKIIITFYKRIYIYEALNNSDAEGEVNIPIEKVYGFIFRQISALIDRIW